MLSEHSLQVALELMKSSRETDYEWNVTERIWKGGVGTEHQERRRHCDTLLQRQRTGEMLGGIPIRERNKAIQERAGQECTGPSGDCAPVEDERAADSADTGKRRHRHDGFD